LLDQCTRPYSSTEGGSSDTARGGVTRLMFGRILGRNRATWVAVDVI